MSIQTILLSSPLVPAAYRTERVAGLCQIIADKLIEDNSKFNLTAVTEENEVFEKHILDSLLAAEVLENLLRGKTAPKLADVGSGAGFPALPIAAAIPELFVTAIDATAKKVGHIEQTAAACGFTAFHGVTGRAENLAKTLAHRERYDAVTARAVARLPILAELCLPLVRTGGVFLAMKGETAKEELADSAAILQTLGGTPESCTEYHIPSDPRPRYFVVIRKTRPTPPKYPRPYAQIAKK